MKNHGIEQAEKSTILKTTTANPGTGWVTVGNANATALTADTALCAQVSVFNNTGTELQFGYGEIGAGSPTGETFEVPDGTSFPFRGLLSTKQLFARRTDNNNTQVSFKGIAERA